MEGERYGGMDTEVSGCGIVLELSPLTPDGLKRAPPTCVQVPPS